MIANHNRVVGVADHAYFLGDVGFRRATLAAVLPRLNGKKRLILGNHDYSDRQMMRFYLEHFQKVMSWRHFTEPDCALICAPTTHCTSRASSVATKEAASTCMAISTRGASTTRPISTSASSRSIT